MTFKRKTEIPRRELSDGESLLLSPAGDRAIVLNPLATAIWHLADGSRSQEEIVHFICGHFRDRSVQEVTRDVDQLTEDLLKAGVLESLSSS